MPAVENLVNALKVRGATVATAESCTGGLLAMLLTERPGSSAVFRGGVSAYHNDVKVALLGVSQELLLRDGAVSAAVAEAMAEGARARIAATYGVSLTGVAGPSGGTAAKPVGTVFLGISCPGTSMSQRLLLSGNRAEIRRAAASEAISALSRVVEGERK